MEEMNGEERKIVLNNERSNHRDESERKKEDPRKDMNEWGKK